MTHWFGSDCMGNTPHAVTVEGVCVCNIYERPERQFYNQSTGTRGTVKRAEDGELHFYEEVA